MFFGVMLMLSLCSAARRVERPHHGMEVDRALCCDLATACNFQAVMLSQHQPFSLLLVEIAYGRANRPELAYRFRTAAEAGGLIGIVAPQSCAAGSVLRHGEPHAGMAFLSPSLESAVMTPFGVAAIVGFKASAWIVVGALAGHGALDAVHGHIVKNAGVPAWWPAFCLAYDLGAAGALAWLLMRADVPRAVTTRHG